MKTHPGQVKPFLLFQPGNAGMQGLYLMTMAWDTDQGSKPPPPPPPPHTPQGLDHPHTSSFSGKPARYAVYLFHRLAYSVPQYPLVFLVPFRHCRVFSCPVRIGTCMLSIVSVDVGFPRRRGQLCTSRVAAPKVAMASLHRECGVCSPINVQR